MEPITDPYDLENEEEEEEITLPPTTTTTTTSTTTTRTTTRRTTVVATARTVTLPGDDLEENVGKTTPTSTVYNGDFGERGDPGEPGIPGLPGLPGPRGSIARQVTVGDDDDLQLNDENAVIRQAILASKQAEKSGELRSLAQVRTLRIYGGPDGDRGDEGLQGPPGEQGLTGHRGELGEPGPIVSQLND